jgi:hypothetical protein
MPDNFTTNPPRIDAINPSVVTHGTILKYGIEDLKDTLLNVTGILVDSYSRSIKFASTEEIVDQNGIVVGVRMSDARADISLSGRIKAAGTGITNFSNKVGDILVCNGDKAVITDISMSAGSKDFVKLDIKATAYEGIAAIAPNS